jgi:hypothetical protein
MPYFFLTFKQLIELYILSFKQLIELSILSHTSVSLSLSIDADLTYSPMSCVRSTSLLFSLHLTHGTHV